MKIEQKEAIGHFERLRAEAKIRHAQNDKPPTKVEKPQDQKVNQEQFLMCCTQL